MENHFNLDDGAKRMFEAAQAGDGISAARVLEEAGSCNWKDLVGKSNQLAAKKGFVLSTSDELSAAEERLTVFKSGQLLNGYGQNYDNRVYPLATFTDKRCENK